MPFSRRMRCRMSLSPYASFLPFTPLSMPQVREPSRYVVAESEASGDTAVAHVRESSDPSWHTVRRERDGLVPSRIDGVQVAASPDGLDPSEMRERAYTSALVLIPEADLTDVQEAVSASHRRMQTLTTRLLALGPHRLPEFKAAKTVRDDLRRLRQTLNQKVGSGNM